MKTILICICLLFSTNAAAIKYFNLGEELKEEVFLCTEPKIVHELVDVLADGREQHFTGLANWLIQAKVCGIVPVALTYTKQVYKRVTNEDVFTVYEAKVATKDGFVLVYVPLKGYLHNEA